MDPAVAYEMRLRFREDMAKAFGAEWRPERLPKLDPASGAVVEWRNGSARSGGGQRPRGVGARIVALRDGGYSLERIAEITGETEERVWALLARWAPALLPEKSEAAA